MKLPTFKGALWSFLVNTNLKSFLSTLSVSQQKTPLQIRWIDFPPRETRTLNQACLHSGFFFFFAAFAGAFAAFLGASPPPTGDQESGVSQSAAEAAEARRCCIVARLTVSRPFNVNVDAQARRDHRRPERGRVFRLTACALTLPPSHCSALMYKSLLELVPSNLCMRITPKSISPVFLQYSPVSDRKSVK